MRRFAYLLVICLLLAGPMVGCTTNPATGQSQLNFMSTQQEISLGEKSAPEFLQAYGGPVPSGSINSFVNDLGQRLASASERPDLPWEFHVVDSQVINAFALPGGKVFMSRGLMAKMTNEAQLAGVLGHEVGHVTAQHIGQQMSRAQLIQIGAAALAVGGQVSDNQWLTAIGVGTQVGGTVYLLKFGRDQESQADSLGLRYMSRLGYNPAAQLQVMQILGQASAGGARQPEIFATHPYPETRIKRIKEELAKNYPNYMSPTAYSYHEERFRSQILNVLATLPPARHTGQEQQQASANIPAYTCLNCYYSQPHANAHTHAGR